MKEDEEMLFILQFIFIIIGKYNYERRTTYSDDGTDSAYGSNGLFIFTVPGRMEMGIHSGLIYW